MSLIEPGLTNTTSKCVETNHLATAWGSGSAAVLATPALVAFCEECARLAIDPLLPDGQQTVGTWISVRHLAATPPGMDVAVQAELKEVDGRRLRFHIEAWDPIEQVADAEHERFIIDVERFTKRVTEKANHVQGLQRMQRS
jgi:predicted thioesterase